MDDVRRPWTRAGILALAGHVYYELAAGAGIPGASRLGPGAAAALWGAGTAVVHRGAGTPSPAERRLAVLNGLLLSAVLAHFLGWPRTSRHRVPWLTECEGMSGRLMAPYNLILYVSGVCAVGGLWESRRRAAWAAPVPFLVVPWLVRLQHEEYARLTRQAHRHPGWWNRRLQRRRVGGDGDAGQE
jgi:hypothetical protein